MARQKKTSKVVEAANTRAASLAAIDVNLDLGNGLTLAAYSAATDEVQTKLDDYNTLLSQVDAAQNLFESAEGDLGELSARMLAAVGVKFTKESDEYEKAGGTKSSERKVAVRKAKPTT